jgi:S1-C subfamily serine protease
MNTVQNQFALNHGGSKSKLRSMTICLMLVVSVVASRAVEHRTWTFINDGRMVSPSGGGWSFKKGGRLDAAFVRVDGTNVIVVADTDGQYRVIPVSSLSEGDCAYLVKAKGVSESDAASIKQAVAAKNAEAARYEQQQAQQQQARLAAAASKRRNPYLDRGTIPNLFYNNPQMQKTYEEMMDNVRMQNIPIWERQQEKRENWMRQEEIRQAQALADLEAKQEQNRILAAQRALLERRAQVAFAAPQQPPEVPPPAGQGTGFFVTDDGYLLTCFHGVSNATRIVVKSDQGVFPAELVKADGSRDLALLKVAGSFHSLPIARVSSVKLGDSVFTIGFPNAEFQGIEPKLTRGDISGLAGIRDDPHHFQISAPVQPGNSGGAVVDLGGNVVGMVTARLDDAATFEASGSLPQNVNYALKCDSLMAFLTALPEVSAKLRAPWRSHDRKSEGEVREATVLVVAVR